MARHFYRGTRSDPHYKERPESELYERSTMAAFICGSLIAFLTVLFWSYFNDWAPFSSQMIGLIIVDALLLLVIAYPAKKPARNILIIVLILIPIGYLDYGPYAYLIVGPLEDIAGVDFGGLGAQAEHTLHCVMILFTDPMSFQTECGTDQEKEVEEAVSSVGLELTQYEFNTYGGSGDTTDVYPAYPLEMQIRLENEGDYSARNVRVETDTSGSDADYRVCGLEIFSDLVVGTQSIKEWEKIDSGYYEYYGLTGKVNDPWDDTLGEKCVYANNKEKIDAKIETSFSYDYATESNLELRVEREYTIDTMSELTTAREKSAPATILMHVFLPFFWEDEAYRTKDIDIRLKNDAGQGKITFRGKIGKQTLYWSNGDFYEQFEDVAMGLVYDPSEDQTTADPDASSQSHSNSGTVDCFTACSDEYGGENVELAVCETDGVCDSGLESVASSLGCDESRDESICCCQIKDASKITGNLILAASSGCDDFCVEGSYNNGSCVGSGECVGHEIGEGTDFGCVGGQVCCCDIASAATSDPSEEGTEASTSGTGCPPAIDGWYWGGEITECKYSKCLDETDLYQELVLDEDACEEGGHQAVYKIVVEEERSEGEYDEIVVYSVGQYSGNITLSCQGEDAGTSSFGGCACAEEEISGENVRVCRIHSLIDGDVELSGKGDESKIFYSLRVEVTDFPEDDAIEQMSVVLHANATYNVAFDRSVPLFVRNPHYD